MINVLVALRVWADRWKGKFVHFFIDNQAVVTILNTGYTRDDKLGLYMRNIWLVASIHDIKMRISHIPGYKNSTADLLSRWTNSTADKEKLGQLVPRFTWEKCESPIST